MMRRIQMLAALALGLAGLLGLAMVAVGQIGGTEAAKQQYEQQLKKIDKNKADELYALARWCYQNGLTNEAMTHALEANQKAPDDVRPKFLIFLLTSPATDITATENEEKVIRVKTVTLTDQEIEKLYKEDAEALRRFPQVQSLLLSRCATPKCHGGNENAKYALITRNASDRKVLADNFKTVYPYLNRDNQADSRLLQMPLKGPEAGHPAQVIRGTNDPVYRLILDWIKTVKTDAQKLWTK